MSDFYQKHLDQVSRSFALCISKLEAPLRQWVSSSYLICRLLDTVEDAPWQDSQKQLDSFQSFDQCLDQNPSPEFVNQWVQGLPKGLPTGERQLLDDASLVFEKFHNYPESVKSPIRDMVKSMSAGMQDFVKQKKEIFKLNTLSEVNRYCFFVAGVVGEILTQLVNLVGPNQKEWVKVHLLKSYHFGLFLQKVNLLKDQQEDERVGRFLVPERQEVYNSLEWEAHQAFRYLQAVPKTLIGYRLFCAWSLFLGLASLPYIEKSFQSQEPIKIPRLKTLSLFKKIETLIEDEGSLERLFLKLSHEVGFTYKSIPSPSSAEQTLSWSHLYFGLLPEREICQLGVQC